MLVGTSKHSNNAFRYYPQLDSEPVFARDSIFRGRELDVRILDAESGEEVDLQGVHHTFCLEVTVIRWEVMKEFIV